MAGWRQCLARRHGVFAFAQSGSHDMRISHVLCLANKPARHPRTAQMPLALYANSAPRTRVLVIAGTTLSPSSSADKRILTR